MGDAQVASVVGAESRKPFLFLGLLFFCLAAILYLFWGSFKELELIWERQEEYSHGYMIPLVALFLFWQKLPSILAIQWTPSRLAPLIFMLAMFGWALGEITAYRQIVAYSFIASLIAVALAVYGWKGFRLSWGAFAYLIFMIPLPLFLYQRLSSALQLISTQIGVAVVELFDISVYVSGNIIDLGGYQLQVVEACSGLRYLFPLMSFGFLISYLYSGPNWHKWLIFLSTIPITILMNSFRIGVIGVTVEYWGIEAAEGFLHDFEGWFVFMACLGVLAIEIWILNAFRKDRKAILDLVDLSYPTWSEINSNGRLESARVTPLIILSVILLLTLPVSAMISDREELVPQRDSFAVFPLLRGNWIGRESSLDDDTLGILRLTDYISADFRQGSNGLPVNFYIAYYQSQRRGSSIHSPRSCIPGGGWLISDLQQVSLDDTPGLSGLRVNRMVIARDMHRQLVYYWFAQRGKVLTSEYVAKWYLFEDALTMQRSDGALVRLVTSVPPDTDIAEADARLREFLTEFYPILPDFLPGEQIELVQPADEIGQAEP